MPDAVSKPSIFQDCCRSKMLPFHFFFHHLGAVLEHLSRAITVRERSPCGRLRSAGNKSTGLLFLAVVRRRLPSPYCARGERNATLVQLIWQTEATSPGWLVSEQLPLVAAHLPDLLATHADAQSEEQHVSCHCGGRRPRPRPLMQRLVEGRRDFLLAQLKVACVDCEPLLAKWGG